LQQLIGRTGQDLQHLRTIDQRVKQQIRDLDRQTELRPEIIQARQSEARQRATIESETYVRDQKINERLANIAAQASHYTPAGYQARGFVNTPPEPGTFDGTAAVKLQTAILGELQEIKWALVLPSLPTSGLSDLLDVTLQSENFALQNRIYAEVVRRYEDGEGSDSQRNKLREMKFKLEREENLPPAIAEARALITEAARLATRIEQVLFSIRTGEQDVGLRVDELSAERERHGRAWQAHDNTNPHTTETGDASQPIIKGGPRGKF
jgi:hypothetical protein